MIASGAMASCLLCLIHAETRVEAGGRFEAMVGQAPTGQTAANAEQNQATLVAVPTFGLHWTAQDEDLRALSATRIFWRPVPLPDQRPLFLETIEASHRARPSRRSGLFFTLRASYGEESYVSLTQQFTNQPSLPPALTALMLNANAEASWQASRRTSYILKASAAHREQVGASDANAAGGTFIPGITLGTRTSTSRLSLPTQTTSTLTPTVRHRLSRRSTMDAFVVVSDVDMRDMQVASGSTDQKGAANILSLTPELMLTHELGRSQQVRTAVGLTYARLLSSSNVTESWAPVAPLALVELNTLHARHHELTVRSSISLSTTWTIDPILGQAVQRGTAQARVMSDLGRGWSASIRMALTADFNQLTQARGSATTPSTTTLPDQTVASLDLPIRYVLSREFSAEFGARYATRGPYWNTPGFQWHNHEAWLFLNLMTNLRTAPLAAAN